MFNRDVYRHDPERWRSFGLVEEPQDWKLIVPRLPRLGSKTDRVSMEIVFQGDVKPYSRTEIRRWARLRNWFTVEVFGSPKAGKTTVLRRLDSQFRRDGITHSIYSEQKGKASPVITNPEINVIYGLRSVAQLIENVVLNRDGGHITRINNFHFYDRGILNAIVFTDAYARMGIDPLVDLSDLVGRLTPQLDMGFLLRIAPDVTLNRGGKMTREFLTHLDAVHHDFSHRLADLSRKSYRPLVLATIDATGTKKDTKDLFRRMLGTVVYDLWDKS